MTSIDKLKRLFKDKKLFALALTHKSWVNEHPNVRGSNERLEFLGDAILEFIVSRELFEKFPEKEEGYLTALRANLVNTINLAEIAKELRVGEALYLSRGEEEGGGRENTSLLANTLEAIIGALFLDSGLAAAKTFVEKNLLTGLPQKVAQPLKDAKSRLQEYVQAKSLAAPRYEVVKEQGPDHDKRFTVDVLVKGKIWGKGVGKNKSKAEQVAAMEALKKLEIE
jgi:ribonuclease-3